MADMGQFRRDSGGVRNEINCARCNRRSRHPTEFRRSLVLRERHPALALDGFDAGAAIRGITRKDNANPTAALYLSQRAEEDIYRQIRAGPPFTELQPIAL